MSSRRPSLAPPGRDSNPGRENNPGRESNPGRDCNAGRDSNPGSTDGRRRSSLRLSQSQMENSDEEAQVEDAEDEVEEEEDEEEEEEDLYQLDLQSAELSTDYWQIHKMVKYLKVGNATCTTIALVGLKDCGLHQEVCQIALKMVGGLEVLLNILRTSNLRCNVGALQVLEAACGHVTTRATVHKLGGLQVLQGLVGHSQVEVQGLAASVLAQVCGLSSARAALIRNDGVATLVALLRVDPNTLSTDTELAVAVEGAARALWACSVCKSGRAALLRAGGLELVGRLLSVSRPTLLVPVVGVIHQCIAEAVFRERVEASGYTSALVKLLHSPFPHLQVLATKALARCSVLEATSARLVREGGLEVLVSLLTRGGESYTEALIEKDPAFARDCGLVTDAPGVPRSRKPSMMPEGGGSVAGTGQPLVNALGDGDGGVAEPEASVLGDLNHYNAGAGAAVGDSELLEAVSEAIWHVSLLPEHVTAVKDLTAVPVLVALLHHNDEKVLTNVVGALGEVAGDPDCCMTLLRGGGVTTLIQLLRRTSDKLLLNVTRALGSCAAEEEALSALLQQDGLRLLWSHLKNPNCRVQASAANAICTCLQQETEGLAEVVRSLVGGIELLVSLLESESEAVLSAVCAAIARIARDPQNLAIMTDYGAVTSLSRLAVRLMRARDSEFPAQGRRGRP
ncbi:outer dynein arm-docking complex subunit 2-like isoform X2 [Homarus americanus]|uniref:outer dynein arm-docking complex subunit 2-like isoform X2 n=1 Tax=Homarus americanus TaxID=6706 RepID=UPI001C445B06|nr:outer dynein arm-docking complex subunit 2-like isoform X2 [Homarus americanus]